MGIISFPTPLLCSNMYLISETDHGIILDPHSDRAMLIQIGAAAKQIDYIILTHEHYDHISGTNALRKRFGCPVLCSDACAARIKDPVANLSHYFNAYAQMQTGEPITDEILLTEDYVTYADATFAGQMTLDWQGHRLELTETPGHSPGSICILLDGTFLFSGDTLLPSGKAMTRFPGGSSRRYREKAIPYLRSLPPDTTVYPGHYEAFRLGDHPDYSNKQSF